MCLLISNTAFASDTASNIDNGSYKIGKTNNGDGIIAQPNGPVAVVIWIGGVIAAWIIDGVLIKATGQSGGEWVAKALDYLLDVNPKCERIYFSSWNGNPVCHSGSKGSFSF